MSQESLTFAVSKGQKGSSNILKFNLRHALFKIENSLQKKKNQSRACLMVCRGTDISVTFQARLSSQTDVPQFAKLKHKQ